MSLEDALLQIGLVWAMSAAIMHWGYVVQQMTMRADGIDSLWALSVAASAAVFCLFGTGWEWRRAVLFLLVALWAARLIVLLYQRGKANGQNEDPRYQALRSYWGKKASIGFLFLYQAEALLAVLLAVPVLVVAQIDDPSWRLLDVLAVLLWCVALGGEVLADKQLRRFRANENNRGEVCDQGLWRYSRHPNYFFEWLFWWVFVVFAFGHGMLSWATLLGPGIMYLFLVKLTGIPPSEKQALRSRGEKYREYQKRTSAFFPWPQKEG